ncbi:Bombesin receptor subtype-3 [Holothuria leucospilota]|uniref:Bombesin receptor subtype-3 n=1 Tax=Holothuria leucospilota TaxID=206669 RepID=A0A9Q1CRN2_HOLLE|nr:Bombesin receptor subtype-3 [Holothuria leucospilota]
MYYIAGIVLLFVLGLTTNSLIILLITCVRELRNVRNTFILVICASNNVFLIIKAPIDLFGLDFIYRSLSVIRLTHYLLVLLSAISILCVLMISFERWRAVVRPMDITSHNVKTTVVKVMSVFMLATILALPTGFVFTTAENEWCNTTYVIVDKDMLRKVTYYCMVTLYICPLTLICFLYFSMATKLMCQAKRIRECSKLQARHRALRSKVACVVVGLAVLFAVCWLPYHLLFIIYVVDPHFYERPFYSFLLKFRLLIFMSYIVVEPVSLFFLSSRFRNYALKMLCLGGNCAKSTRLQNEGALPAE